MRSNVAHRSLNRLCTSSRLSPSEIHEHLDNLQELIEIVEYILDHSFFYHMAVEGDFDHDEDTFNDLKPKLERLLR